ncbi:hypothetical protein ABK040_013677 [Willaertia magna]
MMKPSSRQTKKILKILLSNNNSKCFYSTKAAVNTTTGSSNNNSVLISHLVNQTKIMEEARQKYDEKIREQKVALSDEREGDQSTHNWSLGKCQIFPIYDAYRNASVDTLLAKSFGEVDKEKQTLKLKENNLPTITDYDKLVVTKATDTLVKGYTPMSDKHHKRTQREVGWYLSHVPNSFSQDGCFGAGNQITCLVRVVTDNSVSGLFLKNMILPIRKIVPTQYHYETLILHAPGFQFVPTSVVEEFHGPHPADLGLKRTEFVFENDNNNSTVISGNMSTELLLDAIARSSAKSIFEKSKGSAIVLPSDAIINKDGASTTLFINSTNSVRSALLTNTSNDFTVYGAHYNVLSELGLSRAVGGLYATLDAKNEFVSNGVKKGDIVEDVNGKVRITTRVSGKVLPNIVKAPKNIVFVVEDPNFVVPLVGKVTNPQQLFTSGLVKVGTKEGTFNKSFTEFGAQRPYANAKEVAATFSTLNKADNVYIINGAYEPSTVAKVVKLISTGEVKSLKEEKTSSLFTSLTGSQIESKSWSDKQKYESAIKQLEENVAKNL